MERGSNVIVCFGIGENAENAMYEYLYLRENPAGQHRELTRAIGPAGR